MSYTGDGVAQTQAFAHARKQLASNDKIAQLEGFTTRIPTDGDKHVSVFSQVRFKDLSPSTPNGIEKG